MTADVLPAHADPVDEALARVEDRRLLTGRGTFVHNLVRPAMLHAAFARSSHANGRIVAIDSAAALAVDGVVGILVAADLGGATMPAINPLVAGVRAPPAPLLADGSVAWVGQPVALVVARSRDAARAAADAIRVDVEVDVEVGGQVDIEARQPSQPPDAFSLTHRHGPLPDPAAVAFRVRIRHAQARVSAMPLEPRATVAEWHAQAASADGSRLTAWIPTQAPSRARDDIARLLGLAPDAVRVIAPDVGGAFGAKASVHLEDLLVCFAARRFGAAVRWAGTRSEEFLSGFHGRGAQLCGELAVGHDGALLALAADLRFPLGAWLPFSAVVPARNALRILPGPYRVDAIDLRATATPSPAAPVNIYRGAGRPEAALLMERLIDATARRRGEDPVAFRRRHLVPASAMPWSTPTGETLDAGDFDGLLARACERFDYAAEQHRVAARRAAGGCVGIGVALYIEPCGQGWESARVTWQEDGRVVVASGSAAQGQGHETTYAAIAAEALACDPSRVSVVHGDTATCPPGIGALASRSIAIGGSAIAVAARRIAERHARGEPLPLVEDARYTAPGEAWSSGCVIARMAIDPETGRPTIERIVWVDDAGRILSPLLAEGQLIGGLAQGIGQAMLESIDYDAQGQLLTGSLLDYAMPRATDLPPVEIESRPVATEVNALGAKGVGEAGCIGVPAALLNAAVDALSARAQGDAAAQAAIDALDFPLTAERLWRALAAAGTEPPDR